MECNNILFQIINCKLRLLLNGSKKFSVSPRTINKWLQSLVNRIIAIFKYCSYYVILKFLTLQWATFSTFLTMSIAKRRSSSLYQITNRPRTMQDARNPPRRGATMQSLITQPIKLSSCSFSYIFTPFFITNEIFARVMPITVHYQGNFARELYSRAFPRTCTRSLCLALAQIPVASFARDRFPKIRSARGFSIASDLVCRFIRGLVRLAAKCAVPLGWGRES